MLRRNEPKQPTKPIWLRWKRGRSFRFPPRREKGTIIRNMEEKMSKYFENLDKQIKEYFNILSPEIPSFLEEYIETPEM